MLAARDQENIIHARQTAAAGKPLNQGVRALHPKTPGGLKTPFRAGQNDENRPLDLKGQKTVGKDGPSKVDKTALVTPLGPRNRAPLGAKTTNIKARVFQTPAPAPLTTKQGLTVQKSATARRSGRSKIAVAPSEPIGTDVLTRRVDEEEEPDFGYAPPPPTELPDPPLEVSEDPLLTEELLRGYGQLYCHSPKDKDGISVRLKKEAEELLQHQKKQEQEILDSWNKSDSPTTDELNKQVDAMIAAGPKKSRPQISRVDTMKARSAVAALSDSQPRLPSAAMKPTQASEQKKKDMARVKSKHTTAAPPPSTTRPARLAVSKNTIGFPKAKKAPSIIPPGFQEGKPTSTPASKPRKIDQASIHPRDFRDLYGSPPVESDMWFRLKEYELLEQDVLKADCGELDEELFDTDVFPFDNSKLDDDDFQLPMPE
ncbi:hypothetical protein ABEF95_001260 [Exophiala dermatitidis]|uniref:Uncharacterized protein n=1 Tax=Exophiala dermatitidis (strain ATCC 34100 / CBS 525.76 / NIH/UT8656) TaxID=858893 RepID=H6BL67_EXODN|nr:uncharacterized protein HMPREF1120_00041 [Exophiala dermatitidis NIH/UT8656]EHY51814.1 hypothetical protein HMPREF1120_00041 [Exophiala dermatitidis NIH/UT8656]